MTEAHSPHAKIFMRENKDIAGTRMTDIGTLSDLERLREEITIVRIGRGH